MTEPSTNSSFPGNGPSVGEGAGRRTHPAVYALLVLVMAFWGFAFVAIKALLVALSPIDLTVLRFAFVLAVAVPYLAYRVRQGCLEDIRSARGAARFVGYGLVGVVAYHVSLNVGEQYTSAVVASLIVFTAPVFTLVFSRLLLGEAVTASKAVGVVTALAGAVLVATSGNGGEVAASHAAGAALVFVAPVSWALYTVLGKMYQARAGAVRSLDFSAATLATGSAVIMLLARPSTLTAAANLTVAQWAYLLVLSLACSVFGYVVWFRALETMEAGEVSVFLYLIPIFSQVFAWAILGETLTAGVAVGMALVFAGIYLIERR